MNSYPYQIYNKCFCKAGWGGWGGVCNLESVIKAVLRVFLPLTWRTSSLLGSLLPHSECPRDERILKGHLPCNSTSSICITREKLVRNAESGATLHLLTLVCILTGSSGEVYAREGYSMPLWVTPLPMSQLGTMNRQVSFSLFQVLYSLSYLSHWEERGNILI